MTRILPPRHFHGVGSHSSYVPSVQEAVPLTRSTNEICSVPPATQKCCECPFPSKTTRPPSTADRPTTDTLRPESTTTTEKNGNITSASTTTTEVSVSATAAASCEWVVTPSVVGTGEALGVAEGVAVVGIGVNGVGIGVNGVGAGVASVLRRGGAGTENPFRFVAVLSSSGRSCSAVSRHTSGCLTLARHSSRSLSSSSMTFRSARFSVCASARCDCRSVTFATQQSLSPASGPPAAHNAASAAASAATRRSVVRMRR